MAGSSLPEESPSSYVEGIERRLEAARLAETTDDHLADDGIRRRRFTEYASFLPEESLPLTEATLFREPTISTAARARATKTQARFARRLAQKMENRRQDKSTIRREELQNLSPRLSRQTRRRRAPAALAAKKNSTDRTTRTISAVNFRR